MFTSSAWQAQKSLVILLLNFHNGIKVLGVKNTSGPKQSLLFRESQSEDEAMRRTRNYNQVKSYSEGLHRVQEIRGEDGGAKRLPTP